MSPTQIEDENNGPNLPLALDSGASSEYRAAASWTTPNNKRTQSNLIWIAEFKNEFEGLVSAGTLVQQDQPSTQHLADRFTTYPRYITHVCTERSITRPTCIIPTDNSTHTVDNSNFYLQLPVRAEQQRCPTNYTYCHTHGHKGRSQNADQCGNESARRRPR